MVLNETHEKYLELLGIESRPAGELLMNYEVMEFDGDAGTAVVEYSPQSEFYNVLGGVHGGYICAMLDQAMGVAAIAQSGMTQWFPTLEMKTSFLRPCPGDQKLRVDAEVVKRGRSVVFLAASMRDPTGKLIATASATSHVIDR